MFVVYKAKRAISHCLQLLKLPVFTTYSTFDGALCCWFKEKKGEVYKRHLGLWDFLSTK